MPEPCDGPSPRGRLGWVEISRLPSERPASRYFFNFYLLGTYVAIDQLTYFMQVVAILIRFDFRHHARRWVERFLDERRL